MKALGRFLKIKRKALGLTIQDVADRLNLKYATVANMEAGWKPPTFKQLKIYELVFNCKIIELLNGAREMAKNKNEQEEVCSYLKAIIKEHEALKASEDLKINNDIDAAINSIAMELATKDTLPVSRDIVDLREEIKAIIKIRAKQLINK